MFTYEVSAKEMTDVIHMQFFFEGTGVFEDEHPYNVRAYAKHILQSNSDEDTRNLMEAMVNYGAAAQTYFGYNANNPDDLANAFLNTKPDYSGKTISGIENERGQGTALVKFHSASLILKSETTVRFFFNGPISATYQGQTLEVKQRGGLYYVDVVGISAKALDEKLTVTIDDGTETADISFIPLSYCQSVWNDTTGAFNDDIKNLVYALYEYNQAANVYFKEG